MHRQWLAPLLLLLVVTVALLGAAKAGEDAACGAATTDPLLHRVLNLEPNQHLKQLSEISDTEGSLARTFFSPAHRKAAQQLKLWMTDAGMEAWVDAVGNVHGRLLPATATATAATAGGAASKPAVVLLGSHYDTVLDGGAYDGALGIIVGLAAIKGALVKALQDSGRAAELAAAQQPDAEDGDVVIPPDLAAAALAAGGSGMGLHLVGFTDEEGVRFGSTFLGSRAVAGTLLLYDMLQSKDKAGATLEQVLREEGGVSGPSSSSNSGSSSSSVEEVVAGLALDAEYIAEYVEVHIEQGPVLEARDLPLGVVAGIAGQTRLWVTVNGTQGHAGTVPMRGRRDSLAAAAELVTALEALCNTPEDAGGVPEEENLVCTVGEVKVWPGASNVIAGSTGFSVDIRSKTDPTRLTVVYNYIDWVAQVCRRRGVACSVARKHDAAAVLSDPGVMAGMVAAVRAAEPLLLAALSPAEAASPACGRLAAGLRDVPVLVSGAGHDAMAIAETVPKFAMLFVRCRGGVSHSPLEHVEPADVAASSAALAAYLWGRVAGGPAEVEAAMREAAAAGAGAEEAAEAVTGSRGAAGHDEL
ncbi:hypothetical protein HYH02_003369 [Chlamydomonas schloesseri]|uniref:Peptidase M20 dimerisation domain-containing protein n=1 Tax=Chlamydomonas schloesseri TaxID=2026947 RepID=A0A836BAR3_9CHLO|nr:hypothetical protein HYH02_003369 [Chlamydomonas schloesseri]|eukprot:KAG2452345.1 hypothetical protein HYH02_003369 [Chlamydomonas schloesseri]